MDSFNFKTWSINLPSATIMGIHQKMGDMEEHPNMT